jgi:hypothetical protein
MKKTYYPTNLTTTIDNSRLKSNFKPFATELENYVLNLNLVDYYNNLTRVAIIDKITPYFTVIPNVDPLLVLSANYLLYSSTSKEVSEIDKATHPFYNLFNINIGNVTEEGSYVQSYEISINSDVLEQFLSDYVFLQNPDFVSTNIAGVTVTSLFSKLFIEAAKKYIDSFISSSASFKYDHYSTFKHSTKNLSYLNSKNLFFDFESEYNFYIKEYETLFSSSVNSESVMPNYYAVDSYLNNYQTTKIKNLVSLTNQFDVTKETVLSKQYFIDYATAFKNLSTIERITLSRVNSCTIDSYYSSKINNTLSSENFPYTAKITFSNYEVDSLSDLIKQKNLDTLAVNNLHYLFHTTTSSVSNNYYLLDESETKTLSDSGEYTDFDGNTYTISIDSVFTSESVKSISIDKVYDFAVTGSDVGFTVYNLNNVSFYETENRKYLQVLKKPIAIFPYIQLNNLLKRIRKNRIDYLNVSNKQLLDVYPVCFQIEKIANNTVVGTYTIGRNNDSSEINFFDTQLTYAKPYTYKVYSLDLINSFSYTYTETEIDSISNVLTGTIAFTDDSRIYKNLIINENFEIYDDPPTTVDVNIVPLINRPNAIRFLLNTQSTSLKEQPIIINQNEISFFQKIRKKQKLNSKKVYFETIEDLKSVEVFRTTVEPKKYTDFSNNLYLTLNFDNSTATSFVDVLEQNINYYYVFRSIDLHNNISNPSQIYRVKIINNDGAIYPIVSLYDIEQEQNFNYQKSFKKYISINPSAIFTLLTFDDGVPKIGASSEIWDQKFKVRIRSKKSGKAFDVNLKFSKVINNLVDETNTFETEE